MTTLESLVANATAVREYAVATAALVTAWVAWKGLGAWKRQTTGKLRHSAVLRILRRGLALRSALSTLRNSDFRDKISKLESAQGKASDELAREARDELVGLTGKVVQALTPFQQAVSQAEGLVPKKQLLRGTGPLAKLGAEFAADVMNIHLRDPTPPDGIHNYRPLVLSGDALRAFTREAESASAVMLREFRRHID